MTNKEYVDSVLNDIEKAEIESFMRNTTMCEAVRKVLLAGLYFNGVLRPGEAADPLRNFALGLAAGKGEHTNEQIGADVRAAMEGIRTLEQGFQVLQLYKTPEKKKGVDKNVAR